MKKIVDYALVVLAMFIAVIFYFSFDLEDILWNSYERKTISNEIAKKDLTKDYTGAIPGEDIKAITNIEEWEKTINNVDYVSVVPKSIIKTDVYSLAKWVDYYTKTARGTTGRRLDEVKQTSLDISANYTPYYIIELEDGNHILAQMNRGIAKKIQKGEEIQLPLGKKLGFSKKAKTFLKPICEEMNVDTEYVLYTIDNDWEEKNEDMIFIEKLAISVVLCIILAVVLEILYDKIITNNKEKYELK